MFGSLTICDSMTQILGRTFGVPVNRKPITILELTGPPTTILSRATPVFAPRMANDRDQEIVKSAIADTGSGLLEFLSALGLREAVAFGEGVTLPVHQVR